MPPIPLSLTARTLYSELLELALACGAAEHIGKTPGTLVDKQIRGRTYLYYQYRDLDGSTRQVYLGPDDAPTKARLCRIRNRAEARSEDRQRLDELRAAYIAAGGFATEHAPLRVISAFADAGILRPGQGTAVLVGTHAFNVLGGLLGVRWESQMQTQDIDVAAADDIDLAIPLGFASIDEVLARLDMGFIPIPALDPRAPSTSYRIRGRDLRIDLLTPMLGKPEQGPRFVPALKAPAQPLRFLDYLIRDPIPALMTGRRQLVLLNVPAPERFALHKLVVSEARPSAMAAKAHKDRVQASQLLQVLLDEATDGLKSAYSDLTDRGGGWSNKLERALEKTRKLAPDLPDRVDAVCR